MACIVRALIVGGGIAGLSAAIALSHAGVRCEVVELADVPLGASLGISGRAANALDDLGVYEACHATGRPFGSESSAASIRDADGQIISAGPARPSWPGAKDNIAVYRPVFLGVMTEAAETAGVQISKGITADKVENADDEAIVTFTDGKIGHYDVVVGADGIGSRIRSMVFPETAGPTYAGQMSIRWMTPGPAIPDEGWYLGAAGRVGFYYLPIQNLVYVPAVVDVPDWRWMTDEAVHKIFSRLLESFTAPAMRELRRRLTPRSQLIGRPFEWILLPEPWYRGRTLLIGDAAHATTAHMGMGGGMALEDSVVLGQCIAAAATLPEALETFMRRRFARVRTVVETSIKLSQLEQEKAPPSENRALMTEAFNVLAANY